MRALALQIDGTTSPILPYLADDPRDRVRQEVTLHTPAKTILIGPEGEEAFLLPSDTPIKFTVSPDTLPFATTIDGKPAVLYVLISYRRKGF